MSKRRLAGVGTGLGLLLLLLFTWPSTEAESKPPTVLLPPQLEWVGMLRSAADVNPKPGRFKRILKKIVGLDDRRKAMLLPNGVAVDEQGRVLVADTKERVVHVFDAERKKYKTLRAPESDPFLSPIAIATDAAGKIYVSDSARARVFVFRPDLKFAGTIGGISKTESIFKRCTGLAIDRQRERIYVVDTLAMQVVALGLDGKVTQRFGKPGSESDAIAARRDRTNVAGEHIRRDRLVRPDILDAHTAHEHAFEAAVRCRHQRRLDERKRGGDAGCLLRSVSDLLPALEPAVIADHDGVSVEPDDLVEQLGAEAVHHAHHDDQRRNSKRDRD